MTTGFIISHPQAQSWTLPLTVPIARAVEFYADVHGVSEDECSWTWAEPEAEVIETTPRDEFAAMLESRAKAERQTWAVANIGAHVVPEIIWCPPGEGPTAIPYEPWGWSFDRQGEPPASMHPQNPALYGRYIPIDLDANNRASIEAWLERNPGKEHVPFGWGVCRHGFGLQQFGDGYMSEEVATARAIALNRGQLATDIVNA